MKIKKSSLMIQRDRIARFKFSICIVLIIELATSACTTTLYPASLSTLPAVIKSTNASPSETGSTSTISGEVSGKNCPPALLPAESYPILLAYHSSCKVVPVEALGCQYAKLSEDCKLKLEPSGLIYLREEKFWVAVSDNFNELKNNKNMGGYAIFGFDPTQRRANNTIPAYPLLSESDAKESMPYDLEGLTQFTKGNKRKFYAISSLSLDAKDPLRDIWYRGQGYEFSLRESEDNPLGQKVSGISHWSSESRRDLREWVMSHSGFGWHLDNLQNRAESAADSGGINVEALSMFNDNPLIGFRGPLFWRDSSWQALAAEITIGEPETPEVRPSLMSLAQINGNSGSSDDTSKQFGFRGLAAIPGYPNWYVAIKGSTISCIYPIGCDQLEVLVWNIQTGNTQDRKKLPDKFVAEGVDVYKTSVDGESGLVTVSVGLVDDKSARFKYESLEFKP